jgi:AraC-like DNA-binding protein
MVCRRCIIAVENIFSENNMTPISISLGEVDLGEIDISKAKLREIENSMHLLGFEVIGDKKSVIIESIKGAIIDQIHHSNEFNQVKTSEFLSEKLALDYKQLSKLFSSVEGVTIEQFQIKQRIERVKELIVYDELNLSEISFKLGYSSLAHLSKQFKKVTGLTPSHFKELGDAKKRISIDKV